MAGDWSEAHVRRLFWRAGFGATPAEVERFTAAGRAATIAWLVYGDGPARLAGPAPVADGKPLDPANEWGHDQLWWLDRMVRTTRPLEEKLTLFWHDHFATADQPAPLMLAQNRTLRRHALGSFPRLLEAVTRDPALQLFLSLPDSDPAHPNENFARELMELFTLGRGYGERDVREAARALTGWRSRYSRAGFGGTYYDRRAHFRGTTRIFGVRGRHDWRDVLRLCTRHRNHAPFLTGKLFAFFAGAEPDAATRRALAAAYVRDGRRIAPVVRRILEHPALYADLEAPAAVKAPVVYVAGALRALGRPVDVTSWGWLLPQMGQQLFRPPSVAGWDWGPAWMSSTTMKARFMAATYLLDQGPGEVPDGSTPAGATPADQLERALAALGRPHISAATRAALLDLAAAATAGLKVWARQSAADRTQRALRHLLLSGPDAQLC